MKKLYGLSYYYENVLHSKEEYVKKIMEIKPSLYRVARIPKKQGFREIHVLEKRSGLYLLQKNLNKNFLMRIPLAVPAIGFVRGRSYQDYLKPHREKRFYLRLDISSFFDSITEKQAEESLEEFVQDKDGEIIRSMLDICLLDGHLPQGAVTSPALSNIVFRRIDQRILKYCQSIRRIKADGKTLDEDIIYTRYADDMLFSSDHLDFSRELYFYQMIRHILLDYGFHLNHEKTYMAEGYLSLSGIVLGKDVHLSRKRLGEINRILFYFDKRGAEREGEYEVNEDRIRQKNAIMALNQEMTAGGFPAFDNTKSFVNYLCGYRAFLISFIQDDEETAKKKALEIKVKNLEKLISSCQLLWFGIT